MEVAAAVASRIGYPRQRAAVYGMEVLPMRDIHDEFTSFKNEFPAVFEKDQELGRVVHEQAGPLTEKDRWLIKVGMSGAARFHRALETHILKAREAGATEAEIQHVLLLLITTCGFPTFMESYATYKAISP
jgi:alkylhydroperoxidase/carboxymuconolactone decarboxylase family protein YurZ